MSALGQRRTAAATAILLLLTVLQYVLLTVSPAPAGAAFGGATPFEIDGDTSGANDWDGNNAAYDIVQTIDGGCADGSPEDQIVPGTKLDDVWVTNNGQVLPKGDLCRVWTGSETTAAGDAIFYFAWERDFNQGEVTVYVPLDGPPLGSRSGDTLIKFEFEDSTKAITVTTLDWLGATWGNETDLSANVDAAISADTRFGEAAVNLTQSGILPPTGCDNLVGVSMITETGQAAANPTLKDVVSLDEPVVFNRCGAASLTVVKAVDFAGAPTETFDFTVTNESDFSLGDGGSTTFDYVLDPASTTVDVTAAEVTANLPASWSFVSVSCSDGQNVVGTVTGASAAVTLANGDNVTCTFTNTFAPTPVTVSVSGECITGTDGSASGLLDVTIDPASGATVTVNGVDYSVTTLDIPVAAPGSYPWTAVAAAGFIFNGASSGTANVPDCSLTQVTVSVSGECITGTDGSASGLLDVTIDPASGATVTVNGVDYSVTTLDIPVAAPGSYPWTAVAAAGFIFNGASSGTANVPDCSLTQVTVSVSGECITGTDGSASGLLDVTIDPASGATVTVNGVDYSVTTLDIPVAAPGSYPWTAVAAAGFIFNGASSGTANVPDCSLTQVTVSVSGECITGTDGSASGLLDVTIDPASGATVTVNGVDYSVTTLDIPVAAPGSYPWTAVAAAGFIFNGASSGTANVPDCSLTQVTVSVSGECITGTDGSASGLLDVTIDPASGATVTVNGVDYSVTTLDIPVAAPGSYPWTAVAAAGFIFNGASSGTANVPDCSLTQVTVSVSGECITGTDGSASGLLDVTIDPASGATVTVNGVDYSVTTLDIPVAAPGSYPWTAVAAAGFIFNGASSGTANVPDCSLTQVTVSVSGECITGTDGSASGLLDVTIDPASGATVTVNGVDYSVTTLDIPVAAPGSYPWTAVAAAGFIFNGASSGTANVPDCSLTQVTVSVSGECITGTDGSASGLLDVTIDPASGATVTVNGVDYSVTTLDIPVAAPGSYPWTAVAAAGHLLVGANDGSVTLVDCSETTTTTQPPRTTTTTTPELTSGIGDLIWFDENKNGRQDDPAIEFPIQGATVELLTPGGEVLATQVTGEDGRYLFEDLDAGTYRVRFTFSGATYTTARKAGVGNDVNSDVDPQGAGVGLTALISLPAGVTDLSWDAGIIVEVEGIQIETTTTIEPVTVDTLPFTGFEAGETVVLAMAIAAAGGLLLFAGTRREDETDVVTVSGWSSR